MSKKTDWFASNREEQLEMAHDWQSVLAESGAAWGVPASVMQDFDAVSKAAADALATAKNETTRTPVATARCKAAFEVLEERMRDMKRRYFLSPPLTDADLISLGLKPHDTHPTPGAVPTAQVTVETYLAGRHELGVRLVYVTGKPDDPANKGYRIWYGVVAQGDASAPPPADPDDLRKSFFTKRKKDLIEFDFGDSGKTAYFAVQVENDGKKGPWGPLVSALIP